jgi:hypothetical protein
MKLSPLDLRHPRLKLSWPSEWQSRVLGPNLTEVTIDRDVSLQIRLMVPPVVDFVTWIEGAMREHLSPQTKLTRMTLASSESHDGWPVVFAHYKVDDGAEHEQRVGAFYRIIYNSAEVVLRLRNGVSWGDREAELRPLLLSGTVEWPVYEEHLLWTLLGMKV